jgi:SPP1 gp7 family putative phage head morphogenesis protein
MAEDPRPVSIKQMIGLAPEEAIRFLDAKGYQTSTNWDEVYQEEHVNAFTVAKIAKLDLLRSIHVSLLDAMAEGKPFAQWQAELRPELEAAGWWGKVADEDLTGTAKPIMVGPRRLRTIYDTNLRMARSSALWDRIQAQKDLLPYLRYSAVLDRRTRPLHRAWHGTILPVDHPWWQAHFPPNGWNCRCTVIQLSEAMMASRGWKVTDPAPALDDLVPFYRRSTGERLEVPRGVDPGFAYSPGLARAKAAAEKVAQSLVAARNEGLQLDEAAIAEVLSDLPGGRVSPESASTLARLLVAGEIEAMAALLLDLMTGGLVASATLILDGLIAAASKKKGKHGAAMKGRSYANGGRPDQDRVRGRFVKEDHPEKDISERFAEALVNPTRQWKHSHGPVSRSAIERVNRDAKIDLSGHRLTSHDDELRHAFNDHQSRTKEARLNQRPIVAADFARFSSVLKAPASAARSSELWRGLRVVELSKNISGEVFHVRVAVAPGKAEARFITMFVKKSGIAQGPLL